MASLFDAAFPAVLQATAAAGQDQNSPVSLVPQHVIDVINASKIYVVSMLAILVWDTLALLHLEYGHVWRAKLSAVKVLYLINRYWTPVPVAVLTWTMFGDVGEDKCDRVSRIFPAGAAVTIVVCGMILGIRVWALWGRSWVVATVLALLLAGEVVILAIATSQLVALASVIPFQLPKEIPPCVPTGTGRPTLVITYWAAPLFYDTVVLGLTIFKVIQLRRDFGQVRVLQAFMREAGGHYVVITVVHAINILFYAQPDASIQSINSTASLVLMSLMTARMVLHLHQSRNPLNSSGSNAAHVGGGATKIVASPHTLRSPLPLTSHRQAPPYDGSPPDPLHVQLYADEDERSGRESKTPIQAHVKSTSATYLQRFGSPHFGAARPLSRKRSSHRRNKERNDSLSTAASSTAGGRDDGDGEGGGQGMELDEIRVQRIVKELEVDRSMSHHPFAAEGGLGGTDEDSMEKGLTSKGRAFSAQEHRQTSSRGGIRVETEVVTKVES